MTDMFAERLAEAHEHAADQLCIGIDPHLDKISGSFFARQRQSLTSAEFMYQMGRVLIEVAANSDIASIKLQSAFFEAEGAAGWDVAARLIREARKLGLITILDAKRGDIATTMRAYGRAAFDTLGADAMTVLPYLGMDTLEALRPWLQQGKGVYVVWISSNPGSEWLQEPIASALLDRLQAWQGKHGVTGSCGLVLGATKVDQLPEPLFSKASGHPLLLPGLGAQGAEMGYRLNQLVDTNPWFILPVSRGISGFGLHDVHEDLEQCYSWDDYEAFCHRRVTLLREQLNEP